MLLLSLLLSLRLSFKSCCAIVVDAAVVAAISYMVLYYRAQMCLCQMDAASFLALLDVPEAPGPEEGRSLTRPEESAVLVLGLLPGDRRGGRCRRMQWNTTKRVRKTHKVVHKQVRAKMVRFNMSGRAVTVDALMNLDAKVTKVPGKARWKKWLPEAIQKAAFSQGSLRAIAKSMQDGHGPHGAREYSPTTVMHCRFLATKLVANGTAQAL